MSLRARRLVSWLGTLGVAGALASGVAHLPGTGGLTGEVRWLLGHRPQGPVRTSNPVLKLLMIREAAAHGIACPILATLLYDDDPHVVAGVLWLAHDLAMRPRRAFPDVNPWVPDFVRWFNSANVRTKESLQEALLPCLSRILLMAEFDAGSTSREALAALTGPIAAVRNLNVTDDDLRWLIRASIAASRPAREPAFELVLRAESIRTRDIVPNRAGFLDNSRFAPWHGAAGPAWSAECERNQAGAWSRIELACGDRLAALTRDADEQVRWAAGRLLAVCRDERGLPAMDEYFRSNPGRAGPAIELLSDLFGPDWRKPFESGGAASQRGAGNGG